MRQRGWDWSDRARDRTVHDYYKTPPLTPLKNGRWVLTHLPAGLRPAMQRW